MNNPKKYVKKNKFLNCIYFRFLKIFTDIYHTRKIARKGDEDNLIFINHTFDYSKSFNEDNINIDILPFYRGYKGAVVISSDFELNWGGRFSHNANREKWGAQTREIFDLLLELLDSYQTPITWATVGHLFLESCNKQDKVPHSDMKRPLDFYKNINWIYDQGDWYKHDPCSNINLAPNWYGKDLIEKIQTSKTNHEIGCHSFSHIDFSSNTTTTELVDSELSECIRLANNMSIDLRSFVFPGNFEGFHDKLKHNNFTSYRGYSGFESVSYPVKKNGLWDIHQSMILAPQKKNLVNKSRILIDTAIKSHGVCHLWFHPFALTRVFIKNQFNSILKLIENRTEELWVVTMEELANYMENREKIEIEIEKLDREIVILLKNNINLPFENVPITISVDLPQSFISYTVSINDKEIPQVISDDNRLILDIVPNLHKLSIKQNT